MADRANGSSPAPDVILHAACDVNAEMGGIDRRLLDALLLSGAKALLHHRTRFPRHQRLIDSNGRLQKFTPPGPS